MTIYFKKDKTLSEMVTPIYNMKMMKDSKGGLMLMDMGSQKFFTRTPPLDPSKVKGDIKVVTSNERKNIAGYTCQKADVTLTGINSKTGKTNTTHLIVWFTDKLKSGITMDGILAKEVVNKINGVALQVENSQGDMKARFVATEVSTKPVPDAVFNPSTAGYTERKTGQGFPKPNQ
jgi:hypothetical protein